MMLVLCSMKGCSGSDGMHERMLFLVVPLTHPVLVYGMLYLLFLYLLLHAEWSSTHALRHAGMYLFHPTVHAGPAHTPVVASSSVPVMHSR
jgi:hypothetical protein